MKQAKDLAKYAESGKKMQCESKSRLYSAQLGRNGKEITGDRREGYV